MTEHKRGEILRDARGTLWRVGPQARLFEIDETGKRLKPNTYERIANLETHGPVVITQLASKEPR